MLQTSSRKRHARCSGRKKKSPRGRPSGATSCARVTALGGLAAVSSLTGCGGGSGGNAFAQTGPTPLVDQLRAALLANAGFWEEVQRRFILNPQRLFMNIGTAGSMPRVVVDKFNTDNTAYATDSLNGYTNFLAQRQTMARGGAAGATIPAGNGFGVDATSWSCRTTPQTA